ncbi:serine/threonine-protein kinase [Paludisphaera rhizosphaerae]|uniref:serine/threonine-protein kinase n=1 Tax=Paludisphaera rhizosphaerae TaxID=2711216 RepID=UPI0013EC36AD|nr:serine/threonine-protein kinase [Paludisphaera rhizosphaerae]
MRRRNAALADEVSSLLRHHDQVEEVALLAGAASVPDLLSTEAEKDASDLWWPPPPPTETDEEHDDLSPGARVGRYVVESVVNRGGMGVVYRAHRVDDYRQLTAVKLMGRSLTPTAIRRFQLERQILALMKHPNIVRLLDGGEVDGGRPFLVMDFIEGVSLARYAQETQPSPRECAALMAPIVAAVAYAHESGVVHRDLKPSNILMTRDRVPVPMVTDFGLAQLVDEEAAVSLTNAGGMAGTPGYMAPEQILGNAARRNPAIDVYGLGAVLYFLLTGRPPYRAASPFETCKLALEQDPEPIARIRSGVPRDLATIVETAMARDPSRRYASALAMGEDLRRFLAGEPITARPVSRLERVGRRMLKHRRLVVAAGIAGLAVVIGGFVGLSRWNRDLSRKNDGLIRLAAVYADTVERLARIGGLTDPKFYDDFARFAQAIEEIRQSGGDEASLVDVQYRAALAQFHLARFHQNQHQWAQAVACYESSADLLRSLVHDHPKRSDIRYDLFRTLFCLADVVYVEDAARSVALHRESLDVIAALSRDQPANLDYEEAVASQGVNLGRVEMRRQNPEGEGRLRRAAEIAEDLCRRPGAKPSYRRTAARAWGQLARWRHDAGTLDESVALRAVEAGAAVVRDLPDEPQYQHEQAMWLQQLALIRAEREAVAEAETRLDEAAAMQELALGLRPRNGDYLQAMVALLLLRAEARLALGRIPEALADFAAAQTRFEEAAGDRTDAGVVVDRLRLKARSGPIEPSEAERMIATIPAGPLSIDARILLVRAREAQGRHDEALALATTEAPPEDRESFALQLLAATAEARLGRLEAARARLESLGPASHKDNECLFLARLRRDAAEACACRVTAD